LQIGEDLLALVGREERIQRNGGGAEREGGERRGGEPPVVRQRDRGAMLRLHTAGREAVRGAREPTLELGERYRPAVPADRGTRGELREVRREQREDIHRREDVTAGPGRSPPG